MRGVPAYLESLLGIASNAGVRVEFLEAKLAGGEEWDGLYIMCKELGPGAPKGKRCCQRCAGSPLDPATRDLATSDYG